MPHEIDLKPLAGCGLDLEQYFGLWAVDESRFMAQFDRIGQMNLLAHVELHGAAEGPVPDARLPEQKADDGPSVAIVSIQGTMTKRGSSFGAESTITLRQTIRKAASNPNVGSILLVIDSPGGTVAGTADLAREVQRARESKPVFAYIEDLTASAAYWVASQAGRIYANDNTALVGSIGSFVGLYDLSAKASKEGVRPVVIKAGKYKGSGFAGTEITDEQKAYWQEIVDATQAEFTAAIAAGRRLGSQAAEDLVQGRVWMAAEAVGLKLIDGIQTYEETVVELRNSSLSQQTKRKPTMAETLETSTINLAVPVASYEDLKAALPGADSDFICSQLEKKANLDQARAAWMEQQNKRIEAANKKAEAATSAKEATAKKLGVTVQGEERPKDKSGGGDAVAEFSRLVEAKMKTGMERRAAVMAAARTDPEAHHAYLSATNPQRDKIQGLIDDRFEME